MKLSPSLILAVAAAAMALALPSAHSQISRGHSAPAAGQSVEMAPPAFDHGTVPDLMAEPELRERAEVCYGRTVRAGDETVSGELLITRYGLEGGAIYRLGPILRAMETPAIVIDLKPQLTHETLIARLSSNQPADWLRILKLSPAATALLGTYFPHDLADAARFVRRVKEFPLQLTRARPIEEAISSTGGILWNEIDEALMLRKCPGVFVAGEMIDWEAPTGGYLLQGCFSTGTRAGESAARSASFE